MAKLTGGLFSLRATKRIGQGVTHRQRAGATIAQRRTIPPDARSPAQVTQRTIFSTGLPWWHALLPASRETYRLINPRVNYNAAYINFMRYWLMNQLVDHHEQHEKGEADELAVQKQDSSTVGPSGTPLFNFVELTPPVWPLDSGMTSTTAWAALDLSAWIPPSAIAVLLHMEFIDTGSAAAETYGALHGTPVMIQEAAHGHHINAKWTFELTLLAPIDGQHIHWRVLASGVNTGRLILALHGWLEKAEE